jgi:hypothetical protein
LISNVRCRRIVFDHEGRRNLAALIHKNGPLPINQAVNYIIQAPPLAGMKLKKLSFTPKPELKGLQVIRQMNSLVEIGTALDKIMSRSEFWKKYDEGAFK